MLSFGIEYERAFSIAFWSARFAFGSPPPSFAATMIARASFEKSLPRFASAAPFLCLIVDHLLCPDTHPLPYEFQEALVHARVVGELRMEGRDEVAAVAQQHRLAVEVGEHLHLRPDLADARRADEHAAQRLLVPGEREVGLEAGDLAAGRVAAHREVDEPEVVAVEQDHPGAGPEDCAAEARDRLLEAVEADQAGHRGRLAARDDEPVEPGELLRLADLDDVGAEPSQHRGVLPEVALDCEDADAHPPIVRIGLPATARTRSAAS